MRTDIPMSGIKASFKSVLESYGYYIRTQNNGSDVHGGIAVPFHSYNEFIYFRIAAGTARKFDVFVEDDRDNLLVDYVDRPNNKGLAFQRFNRSDAGVQNALMWIANANKNHTYLKKIMQSVMNSPHEIEPRRFEHIAEKDGCYCMWESKYLRVCHGEISSVLVLGIITIDKTLIRVVDQAPDTDAWFLMQITWRSKPAKAYVAVNGDLWYSVHRTSKVDDISSYSIIETDDKSLEITTMDAQLMQSAMTEYANWLAEPERE